MDSLPPEIVSFIWNLKPLFRVEVFESFSYLMTGLLIGEARCGVMRASVFAPAGYQPQRLSDLFTSHKLSHEDFTRALIALAMTRIYRFALPVRLFWIIDTTFVEKPFSKKVAEVKRWHRTKQVVGRAKYLKGHCYLFAAHLYRYGEQQLWASVLCAAILVGKRHSLAKGVKQMLAFLPPIEGITHVWIADRALMSGKLISGSLKQKQAVLGRIKCNKVVYFAPRRQKKGKGRKKICGAKSRVDQLVKRYQKRLPSKRMRLCVAGKERNCQLWDALVLLRGVKKGKAVNARVIIVRVLKSKMKPLYLLTTDLELEVCEAIKLYLNRAQIETNFDEIKELGLSNYMGRSQQGIVRWALFGCLAQMILKLMATGHLSVKLPFLNWSWYKRENTVGQIRRRLVEFCRPRISRMLEVDHNVQEIRKAA